MIKLLAGNSNIPLAKDISKLLGIKLVDCTIGKFANSEIQVEINETIRGYHVFIIQTGGSDNNNSVNDYLMETLLMIDACKKSSALTINVILASYPYARSDKKDKPRVPIGSAFSG